ncbi:MAG: hypothetical protein A2Z16_00025 [Chloroflexi bacterium RBG_16_54_18]|nr:MAG: hypothetical protein A2Z16_00025 [Chloroflexi bacterium RBG_16_54_18]
MALIQNPLHNLEGYLRSLCISIGERPVGSRKNHLTQEFIGDLFQRRGYAVEYQEFDCLDWKAGEVSLLADGEELPALISPYSLAGKAEGPLVRLGDLPALESSDLRGKIAFLHSTLTRETLMPKNFPFYNPNEHRRIVALLEQKNPLAIVLESPSADGLLPVIEDGDFEIPSLVISQRDSPRLKSAAVQQVSLSIDVSRRLTRAANVIARRFGGDSRRKMVLTAHLDTKPGTPGALDNASGVATLLGLSPLVTTKFLDFELEFVALNGEDYYSSAGEVAYLEAYRPDFKRIFLEVNVDGIGLKGSPTGISYHGMPAELLSTLESARQGFRSLEVIEPWPQGDHMLFTMYGVPALTLTSSRIFELIDTVVHTPQDTYDLLDLNTIWEAALFLSEVLSKVNEGKK